MDVAAWAGFALTVVAALITAGISYGKILANQRVAMDMLVDIHKTMNGGSRCQRHSDEIRVQGEEIKELQVTLVSMGSTRKRPPTPPKTKPP